MLDKIYDELYDGPFDEEYEITQSEVDEIVLQSIEFGYSFNTPIWVVLDEVSVYFQENDFVDAVIYSMNTMEDDQGFHLEVLYTLAN